MTRKVAFNEGCLLPTFAPVSPLSARAQVSSEEMSDENTLIQPKELTRPGWNAHQHTFARLLRDDPSTTLRELHHLWKRTKLTRSFSPDCDLAQDLTVLAEGFVDPENKGNRKGISTAINLGDDLWRAFIETEFLPLLIDVIVHCDLKSQPRVRTHSQDQSSMPTHPSIADLCHSSSSRMHQRLYDDLDDGYYRLARRS